MPFNSLPSPSNLFPTYLVPSLSFRRRQSSVDSSASFLSTSTAGSPPTSDSYLSGHASHLRCARCLSDLALSSQIISKGFTGRHGPAYLVAPSTSAISASSPSTTSSLSSWMAAKARNDALPNLPNTYTHKPVPRQLVTGAHTVGDISCAHCGSVLGWKYIHAEDESQKYKIGKFILETKRVCRSSTWETTASDAPVDEDGMLEGVRRDSLRRRSSAAACPPSELTAPLEEMEFDSGDEDEREALFMGMWTPQMASRIRKEKAADFARDVLMEED
ncbi:Putative Yippee family protein [Septoria linicola]|uniref:Yippee family protein n=1 Tax=Septoria linicola TaxID=215465 RepID=A0A9Q9EN37_9PEZI|nr:Putative Yippee family protein [Septoria linicola]